MTLSDLGKLLSINKHKNDSLRDERAHWFTWKSFSTCGGVLVCHKKKITQIVISSTGNECSPCCYLRSPQSSHPLPTPRYQLGTKPLLYSTTASRWTTPSSLERRGCNLAKCKQVLNPSFKSHQSDTRALKRLFARLFQLSILLSLLFLSLLIYGEPIPTSWWICLKRNLRYAARSPVL